MACDKLGNSCNLDTRQLGGRIWEGKIGGITVRRMLSDCCLSCPVLSVTLVYCDQTVGWIKMKLETSHADRPRPGQIVLDWSQFPLSKRGGSQFSAHVCCGQTAGWIKMTLGMEVGLGPGHIVLDEDPALPPQKGGGHSSPQFSAHVLWPNGWTDQDATWYDDRPRSRPNCGVTSNYFNHSLSLATPTYTIAQIAERFEPNTVLWAFRTVQPSS